MDLWLIMIILHAVFGVICFITGFAILSPRRVKANKWVFTLFLVALIGLIVFMVGAMLSHWPKLSATEQITFSGLVMLALYMFYRAMHALKLLRKQDIPAEYIDDIGFSLISLFNGFIIVGLIDLHASVWVVIAGSLIAAGLGTRHLKNLKQSYVKSGINT